MKPIFYGLVFILISKGVAGQVDGDLKNIFLRKADSAVLQKVKLNFAVPDIPAFKALGVDPSFILRPSAVADLAFMVGSFAGNGFSTIPKDVAIEVAPGLLIKPWYTLQDYRTKGGLRLLTKTRISLGTNENAETKVNDISVGLRTTIFDNGDFRLNGAFQKENIFSKMDFLQNDFSNRLQRIQIKLGMPVFMNLSTDRQREIRDSVLNEVQTDAGFMLDTVVKNSIAKYKRDNWNASRMDFAYALLLRSPDSLIGKIKLNKHSFWTTLAIKPGANNTWAQLLLGINDAVYKDGNTWMNEFTGNLRFYGGTNKFKGLFEVQYQNKNIAAKLNRSTLFTQLGVEVSFFNGMWIQFSTGIINALEGDNKSALKSNLNLSFSFPESFKL